MCEGRFGGDAGMTIHEINDFILTQVSRDVDFIYNADGGGSSIFVFDGKKIDANHESNSSDIRYRPEMMYVEPLSKVR